MTKEQFVALGVSEEIATKAAEQSQAELKGYVPVHRFEEVNTENKTLKEDAKKHLDDLETLKKTAGNSEELQNQIKKLQDDNKEAAEKYQGDLKQLQMTNAIKIALAGKVHDEDLVAGLFDTTKLLLGTDGKVTGLDEQLKALQEQKKFLFKEEQQNQQQNQNNQQKTGFRVGAQQQDNNTAGDNKPMSIKEALTAHFSTQK